jgi:hypothetical protein
MRKQHPPMPTGSASSSLTGDRLCSPRATSLRCAKSGPTRHTPPSDWLAKHGSCLELPEQTPSRSEPTVVRVIESGASAGYFGRIAVHGSFWQPLAAHPATRPSRRVQFRGRAVDHGGVRQHTDARLSGGVLDVHRGVQAFGVDVRDGDSRRVTGGRGRRRRWWWWCRDDRAVPSDRPATRDRARHPEEILPCARGLRRPDTLPRCAVRCRPVRGDVGRHVDASRGVRPAYRGPHGGRGAGSAGGPPLVRLNGGRRRTGIVLR